MKLKNKRDCYLKRKVVVKGEDGEKYAVFTDEAVKISVTVCSGGGQMQDVQMGNVQQWQKKLLYDEPYTVTVENGVETYWFRETEYSMAVGDGVCIYANPEQPPDYRIIAIHPFSHLRIILEKMR